MKRDKIIARVSQKTNARYHAATDDPTKGIVRHRNLGASTTDFICCAFIIDGDFAQKNKAFSNIQITNRWTCEQCLGDEILKYVGAKDFHKKVTRLNRFGVYSYKDGVSYHAGTAGLPQR